MDIAEKNIEIDSCQIYYLQSLNTKGKDIILLHGMKFNADTWKNLGTLEKLTSAGYRATALDLPGFGKTPVCELQPEQVVEKFIKTTNMSAPILVGPSMSGRIGIEFAVNHPDMLGGLVLIGAVGVAENKERLPEIKIPTLILWGSDDAVSPIANGHLLHQEIKGSNFFIIESAPHPCYLEHPDIWHQQLLKFAAAI